MWVSLTDKNCYKIVLAIHLTLGSPDNVFIVMAIKIKPPYEQTIAEHLIPIACFCNIKHRLVAVCFKEFLYNCYNSLP